MIVSVIDQQEKEIVSSYHRSAPVDIVGMASALGINVWEDRLGDKISGKLFRDQWGNGGSSGFSITVNSSDALVRKRFTIAHEIAHFLLHKNQVGPSGIEDDTYYRSGLSNAMETQANKLAAELLMPSGLIEGLMEKGIKTVDGLAAALRVSGVAMQIRLGIPVL